MSAPKAVAPKVTRAKKVAPAAPVAAANAEKPAEPLANGQQPPAEGAAAPADAAVKKQKKQRKMLADVIDVTISTARVRNYVSDEGFNLAVHTAAESLNELKNYGDIPDATLHWITRAKPEMTPAKMATAETKAADERALALWGAFSNPDKSVRAAIPVDEATTKSLKALVNQHLLRTGDDAITALAATANFVVEEMAHHGAKSLKASGKKTLQVYHVANDELENLSIWPFISNLPSVKEARVAYARHMQELESKGEEKKEKRAKKAKGEAAAAATPVAAATPAAVPEAATAPPAVDPAAAASAPEAAKKPRDKVPCEEFKYHTYSIFRAAVEEVLGTNEAGKRIGDVSNDIRVFGSHVVFEFIARYSPLIRLASEYSGVKTIKASTINAINRLLATDAGVPCAALDEYVSTRVSKCIDYAHAPAAEAAAPPAKAPEAAVPAEPAAAAPALIVAAA
jgi:hypothetical protein